MSLQCRSALKFGFCHFLMKVVLTVHQFLPDFFAGTEIITLGIAKELMRRGHEVIVVTGFPSRAPVSGGKRFDSYVYEGIRVERFWHSHAPADESENVVEADYNNPLFGRFFSGLLREFRPDVVHFIHLARLSASAIEACARQRVPMIYTATDFWLVCPLYQLRLPDNSMCGGPNSLSVNCVRHHMQVVEQVQRSYDDLGQGAVHLDVLNSIQGVERGSLSRAEKMPGWLFRLLVWAMNKRLVRLPGLSAKVRALSKRPAFMRREMNRLDLVLAPSHIVKTMLVRGGLEPHRVRLLPYGIDLKAIRRDTSRGEKQKLRVGFIGSLYEHKGPHLLVQAVRSLPPGVQVELCIFGRPDPGLASAPYFQKLRRLIGDDARIELCGPFPNEQVGRVLSGIDVLVVPSVWYENTPVVIYEALAAGCPVVASDMEGIAEIVRHEENGLLFPKEDIPALAACLERLARDRALLKRLARQTRIPQSVAEHVAKLEDIYREVQGPFAARQPASNQTLEGALASQAIQDQVAGGTRQTQPVPNPVGGGQPAGGGQPVQGKPVAR